MPTQYKHIIKTVYNNYVGYWVKIQRQTKIYTKRFPISKYDGDWEKTLCAALVWRDEKLHQLDGENWKEILDKSQANPKQGRVGKPRKNKADPTLPAGVTFDKGFNRSTPAYVVVWRQGISELRKTKTKYFPVKNDLSNKDEKREEAIKFRKDMEDKHYK